MLIPLEQKLDVLWGFVRTHLQAKTLIFFSSCKQVAFVHAAFSALRPGVPLLCLHGRQKQMKRLAVYTEFGAKKHAVLFATDVAARGLDFPTVQWVVQADVPEDVPTYIHRTGRTARHTAHGRALLLLSESERAFLDMLASARITLQRLRPNKQKLHALAPKLRALLSQRSDIKYTAQRAVVSYVRSVRLQANKEVFDATALPLQAFAESYGLAAAPRVRNLAAAGGKGKGRNWEGGGGESSDEGAGEEEEGEDGASSKLDGLLGAPSEADGGGGPSRAEEGGESSEEEGDGEEGLILKPKQKKAGSRNKLLRLLDRNIAERRGGSAAADTKKDASTSSARVPRRDSDAAAARCGAGAADDLFTVKRRIAPTDPDAALGLPEPAAEETRPAPVAKKIKLRKGGTVAGSRRTVFDEEGRPLEEKLEGAFSAVIEEKGDASLGPQNPEVRAATVREALRAADSADRERERARIRERHRLQKQKRKAAEAEAAGFDAHGRRKEAGGPAVLGGAESDGGSDAGGEGSSAEPASQMVKKKAKRASAEARGSSTDADRIQTDERRAEELLARLLPA
jgi:ATP-dependent RNA helicase DDX10/DBP4